MGADLASPVYWGIQFGGTSARGVPSYLSSLTSQGTGRPTAPAFWGAPCVFSCGPQLTGGVSLLHLVPTVTDASAKPSHACDRPAHGFRGWCHPAATKSRSPQGRRVPCLWGDCGGSHFYASMVNRNS